MKSRLICAEITILVLLSLILFLIVFFYDQKIDLLHGSIKVKTWELETANEKLKSLKERIDRVILEDTLATQIVFSGRKQDFLLFLDFFDDNYGVKNVNYYITNPKKVKIRKESKYYDVAMVKISMQFETNSELKLYMFIEDLMERIPGYVYIQTFDFAKSTRSIKGFLSFKVYVLQPKK